jgi:hypothetical protein
MKEMEDDLDDPDYHVDTMGDPLNVDDTSLD